MSTPQTGSADRPAYRVLHIAHVRDVVPINSAATSLRAAIHASNRRTRTNCCVVSAIEHPLFTRSAGCRALVSTLHRHMRMTTTCCVFAHLPKCRIWRRSADFLHRPIGIGVHGIATASSREAWSLKRRRLPGSRTCGADLLRALKSSVAPAKGDIRTSARRVPARA